VPVVVQSGLADRDGARPTGQGLDLGQHLGGGGAAGGRGARATPWA